MAELSEREIKILIREIDRQGLTYTQLQNELLDHLCCDIEAKMEEGIEFLNAYEEVRSRLENNRIQEIQEETLLLINQKYRMMKKFMYILGTIAPSLLILGAFFKMQHWPGASVLIVLGAFLLGAVYLPVFAMVSMRDTRKKEKRVNKTLYVTGVITGFIFITGILFKIMHWPGARDCTADQCGTGGGCLYPGPGNSRPERQGEPAAKLLHPDLCALLYGC